MLASGTRNQKESVSISSQLREVNKSAAPTPNHIKSQQANETEVALLTAVRSMRDENGTQEIATWLPALQTAARQM